MDRFQRRVWGMSKGVYIVLTIVVCLMLAMIPVAGAVLALLLAAGAIVFWCMQKRQDVWSYVPRPAVRYVKTELHHYQEVVGESFYQRQIGGLVSVGGREVQATFTHEPGNPKDRNAVRVDLVSGSHVATCGYLPAAVAPGWVPMVRHAADRGEKLICDALVRGGRDEAPNYGVWLRPQQKPRAAPKPTSGRKPGPRFEVVDNPVKDHWADQKPLLAQETRANRKPDIESFVESVSIPNDAIDLRHLDARRLRVVGSSFHLNDGERLEAWTYVLQREPDNSKDVNAIAVHLLDERKVGYVSAKQAELYAPLLDRLGSRFVICGVGSEGTTSSRLWIDLPRVPALRDMVELASR